MPEHFECESLMQAEQAERLKGKNKKQNKSSLSTFSTNCAERLRLGTGCMAASTFTLLRVRHAACPEQQSAASHSLL